MAYRRGTRIRMISHKSDQDEPDEKFGKVLSDNGGGTLLVATDEGATIVWQADETNTEVFTDDEKAGDSN